MPVAAIMYDFDRTLCTKDMQDYRDTGLLGYVQLPGKIIYRESEILDLLERHYRK